MKVENVHTVKAGDVLITKKCNTWMPKGVPVLVEEVDAKDKDHMPFRILGIDPECGSVRYWMRADELRRPRKGEYKA